MLVLSLVWVGPAPGARLRRRALRGRHPIPTASQIPGGPCRRSCGRAREATLPRGSAASPLTQNLRRRPRLPPDRRAQRVRAV